MKVLIIRFSSIGDIVLTTPILRCLHHQKNATIHYLTKDAYVSLLRNNPYIHKIHTLTKTNHAQLKSENYDIIIDLHKNLRSLKFRSLLGGKHFSFDKVNFKKWLQVRFKMRVLPDLHIVDRYFAGISDLGIRDDGKGLDFFIDPEISDRINSIIPVKDYYCLVLGANYYTKRIPIEKCREIIEFDSNHVVLIGGKDTGQTGQTLNEEYPEKVIDMSGKINIQESAVFLKSAKYVVTGDTGMMHIAAALQKPIKIVWGNTIPEFGMYPFYGSNYQDNAHYYQVQALPCRPCSKLGFNECPKGHFDCMMKQELQKIHD